MDESNYITFLTSLKVTPFCAFLKICNTSMVKWQEKKKLNKHINVARPFTTYIWDSLSILAYLSYNAITEFSLIYRTFSVLLLLTWMSKEISKPCKMPVLVIHNPSYVLKKSSHSISDITVLGTEKPQRQTMQNRQSMEKKMCVCAKHYIRVLSTSTPIFINIHNKNKTKTK